MQKTISSLQLFIILVNICIGAGLIVLPRTLSSTVHEDIWLTTLVGGLAVLIAVCIAVKLSEFFPNHTSIEYHCILLGQLVGQFVNAILLIQLIMVTALSLRIFSATCKLVLFDMTPVEVINFTFLSVAAYMGHYGFQPHIRAQQFLFIIGTPLFIGITLLGIFAMNVENYQPFLANGLTPVIKGSVQTWLTYSGAELMIGLIYPFLTRSHRALKTSIYAGVFVISLTVLVVLIVQGILGAADIERQIFPTIIAFREVEIPETFVERIDGYFLVFWILGYFLSLANFLYFTAFGIGRLLHLEYCRPVIWLLAPFISFVSLLPSSLVDIDLINKWVNVTGMIWGLVILPCLLALAWFKARGRCPCE